MKGISDLYFKPSKEKTTITPQEDIGNNASFRVVKGFLYTPGRIPPMTTSNTTFKHVHFIG